MDELKDLLKELIELLKDKKKEYENLIPDEINLLEAKKVFLSAYDDTKKINVSRVSKELNVSRNTVYKWIKLYKANK